MGLINQLCIRQLKRAESTIRQRIEHATKAADQGLAEWELHAEAMRTRLADLQHKIAFREARER